MLSKISGFLGAIEALCTGIARGLSRPRWRNTLGTQAASSGQPGVASRMFSGST